MGARGPLRADANVQTVWALEPMMPLKLSAGAVKHWRRLVPILLGMNILTEADGDSLARLCIYLAEWYTEMTRLDPNSADYGKRLRLCLSLEAAIKPLSDAFALCPAARARMHVEPPKPEPYELEKPVLTLRPVGTD